TSHQFTTRNTPSILGRSGPFFWDGRAANLHQMVMMPVKNSVEMNTPNLKDLAQKLSKLDYYKPLISKAFNGKTEMDSTNLRDALAEFVNCINFSNNKFTRVKNGQDSYTDLE